jgi:hypothetical protein
LGDAGPLRSILCMKHASVKAIVSERETDVVSEREERERESEREREKERKREVGGGERERERRRRRINVYSYFYSMKWPGPPSIDTRQGRPARGFLWVCMFGSTRVGACVCVGVCARARLVCVFLWQDTRSCLSKTRDTSEILVRY